MRRFGIAALAVLSVALVLSWLLGDEWFRARSGLPVLGVIAEAAAELATATAAVSMAPLVSIKTLYPRSQRLVISGKASDWASGSPPVTSSIQPS